MSEDPIIAPAFSAYLAALSDASQAREIVVEERRNSAVATIMARRGRAGALAALLSERYALKLPGGPSGETSSSITFIGTGPNVWLAVKSDANADWVSALGEDLAAHAAVSDQSSAYAILRLRGAEARELLQRGVSIDLHPNTFQPGAAAVTDIAHIGVILIASHNNGFDVAIFRSYAGSFWHWLSVSARDSGLSLTKRAPIT